MDQFKKIDFLTMENKIKDYFSCLICNDERSAVYAIGSFIQPVYFDEQSDIDLIIVTDLNLSIQNIKDQLASLFDHRWYFDVTIINQESYQLPFDRKSSKFCVLTQSFVSRKLIYGIEQTTRPLHLREDFLFCLQKKITYYSHFLDQFGKKHENIPFKFHHFDELKYSQENHRVVVKTLVNLVSTRAGIEFYRLHPDAALVSGKLSLLDLYLNDDVCRQKSDHHNLLKQFHALIKENGRELKFKVFLDYVDLLEEVYQKSK